MSKTGHSTGAEAGEPDNDNTGGQQFNLERFRLSQDFAGQAGVKKALVTVPVRKPDRQTFVRVHPDPAWRLDTAALHVKEERETYLVDPSLWTELSGELVPTAFFTAITMQKTVILWPVRLPGADGRHDAWSRSAFEAATLAMRGWVRVAANMQLGAYEIFQATAAYPEPEWPDTSLKALVTVAFRDKQIENLAHPVIRRLRGEG